MATTHASVSVTKTPWRTISALVRLTKPGVTALLTFTSLATAVAASGPWLSLERLGYLAMAGSLTAGGAAAINQYLERDLDAQMPRTSRRVLPVGESVAPLEALLWGVMLCVWGLVVSLRFLPLLTTVFILLGVIIYIPVYTMSLKRSTPMNVVIGGFAGCCPILAAWSAVRVDWPIIPFALAALVFFWTPAHFWPYALVHREAYRKAAFPMLPVTAGYKGTIPFIFAHGVMMVLASAFALHGIALYVALLLGVVFLIQTVDLWRLPSNKKAYRLYKVSNYYLVMVFLLMAVFKL